ncbi:MAG: cytochrome C [Betaproteobacteria bacterium]|jgi:mono/diheme cytochrome c family protein|nr:cytochrome C [Betaproteobacteria bacterium]
MRLPDFSNQVFHFSIDLARGRLALACALLCVALPAAADSVRGRTLYENHCEGCHSTRVHEREQKLPANLEELRRQVDRWQALQSLRWSADDIRDVVDYLNLTKYRF